MQKAPEENAMSAAKQPNLFTQRKGFLPLEMVVDLLPRLLLFVILIAVLVGFILTITSPQRTPEYLDFRRVGSEIDILTTSRIDDSITVPKSPDTQLDFTLYPAGQNPRCTGAACLCALYTEGNKYVEQCKRYPDISSDCSNPKHVCISEVKHAKFPPGTTEIKLVRSGNDIYIS